MTLVDANVLLDLTTEDPRWIEWSISALASASLKGPHPINDSVYAEFAVRYERIEDVEDFLDRAGIELSPLPRQALFLAGKVFRSYRRRAASGQAWRRISSSGRTPPCWKYLCLPAMHGVTAPIFRPSNW